MDLVIFFSTSSITWTILNHNYGPWHEGLIADIQDAKLEEERLENERKKALENQEDEEETLEDQTTESVVVTL